ncbi:MAG: AAA family ATPase [Cyanobacteria bacterium P01_H01_bin.74]
MMTDNTVTVLVIDTDQHAKSAIASVVNALDGCMLLAETDSLFYGYELIRQNRPSVVFIDISDNFEKTLETIERVSLYFKETLIIASGYDMGIEELKACMVAGVRDFIKRPFSVDDVEGLFEKHEKALFNKQEDKTGSIITIYSNKGGLGKTTIAVNLALALSESVNEPVVLVDLNLQLGDVTTFLDVEPKQTIVDIARDINRVDAAYLYSSLAEYTTDKAKLYILADPLYVEDAEDVTTEKINAVLTLLKASFRYVVIDTNTAFDNKTLSAMDLADNILMVSMVNLPSIRNSQRLLRLFDRLGYSRKKIKLVLNRYMPDEEITVDDVEETLEHQVFWRIPNNYMVVMTAINRGVPITAIENSKSLGKNFLELAHKLTGVLTEAPKQIEKKYKTSLFSGLFAKK